MAVVRPDPDRRKQSRLYPFRAAVWRGLGVLLPPLLTVVIFLWIGNTVRQYALEPVERAAREWLVWGLGDIRQYEGPGRPPAVMTTEEGQYVRVDGTNYVPQQVVDVVRRHQGAYPMPNTALDMYRRYVEIRYLKPVIVIPVFLSVFILLLYLLGKFLAFGIGRFFWGLFERGVTRLPLVRNVYSSVKQVTDLMFSEHELEYTRIVAVEFPAKGIWSVGFVTSESLADIEAAANEPVVAVLIPYAPLPITGCVITVRKSETIDLDMTFDQAFQFIVSCGVVVPPHQLPSRARRTSQPAGNGAPRSGEEQGADPRPLVAPAAGRPAS